MKGTICASMAFERDQGLLMVHGLQFSTLFCFCFNFPLRLKEFIIKVKNSSSMPLKWSDSLNAFVFDPKLSVGCVPAFALLTWWCLHILHILHPEHNQKISIKPSLHGILKSLEIALLSFLQRHFQQNLHAFCSHSMAFLSTSYHLLTKKIDSNNKHHRHSYFHLTPIPLCSALPLNQPRARLALAPRSHPLALAHQETQLLEVFLVSSRNLNLQVYLEVEHKAHLLAVFLARTKI